MRRASVMWASDKVGSCTGYRLPGEKRCFHWQSTTQKLTMCPLAGRLLWLAHLTEGGLIEVFTVEFAEERGTWLMKGLGNN
eukprot:s179_g2.t1